MTFFTLGISYSVNLHKKIFQMIYYSNGGFNWTDLYYMPIKLREFYWRELLHAKDEEKQSMEKATKGSKPNSKIRRR